MRKLEHILPAWASQDIGALNLGSLNLGNLGARLFQGGRKETRRAASSEELTLIVSVSDVGYRLLMQDGAGAVKADLRRWLCVDSAGAGPAAALAHAVAQAPRGTPLLEENIGAVVLLLDDPLLHITDHRAARLSNFEPRALRAFGVQQAGGKPVVFNSRAYGETGEKELERRVIAYLPEERLESLFFPLGARATALRSIAPAAAVALDGGDAAVMSLRVHGYFSTITLATPQSGVITSRQIPLGALSAAVRYATAFGLPLDQACAAMAERARFAPVEAVLADREPAEYATASFAALAPFLRSFYGEIAATLDYYQFERYADRPGRLDIEFTGPALAGLDSWLGDALDMAVAAPAQDLVAAQDRADGLNLLENVRPGLLKIGADPFQFEDGAFRRADSPRNRRSAGRPGSQKAAEAAMSRFSFTGLFSRKDRDADAPARPAWIAPAFMAVAAPVLLVVLNMNFLLGPAQQRLERSASAYASALGETQADPALTAAAAAPAQRSAGWAQNLVSLGDAMLPAMRVTSISLDGEDVEEGQAMLRIDGVLPEEAGGDLRLVAGFIDRLGKDAAFAREFPRIDFAGLAAPDDSDQDGASFAILAVKAAPVEAR